MEDRQLVLHEVGPLADRRKGEAELAMFDLAPAGPDADLDAAAAHLIDRRDDLGERPRVAERDRRHEHAQTDPVGVAGEPGHDRPGIRGRLPGRPGKALEVVGTEEGLEPVGLGPLGDRDMVAIAQALLGFEHEGEAHRGSSVPGR